MQPCSSRKSILGTTTITTGGTQIIVVLLKYSQYTGIFHLSQAALYRNWDKNIVKTRLTGNQFSTYLKLGNNPINALHSWFIFPS